MLIFTLYYICIQATTESAVDAESNDLELHRSALQSALDAYVAAKFQSVETAGTVVAKNDQLQLFICTEKPNLRNFWSGKWTSVWTIAINGSNATISGDIKVRFSIKQYNYGFNCIMYCFLTLYYYHLCVIS